MKITYSDDGEEGFCPIEEARKGKKAVWATTHKQLALFKKENPDFRWEGVFAHFDKSGGSIKFQTAKPKGATLKLVVFDEVSDFPFSRGVFSRCTPPNLTK